MIELLIAAAVVTTPPRPNRATDVPLPWAVCVTFRDPDSGRRRAEMDSWWVEREDALERGRALRAAVSDGFCYPEGLAEECVPRESIIKTRVEYTLDGGPVCSPAPSPDQAPGLR